MKYKILLAALLISGAATAQKKQNVYLLKNNDVEVKIQDSADYIRIIEEPDSGDRNYVLREYYKSGKLKRMGKVSSFSRGLIYEGQLGYYDSTGKKSIIESYNNGSLTGEAYYFYPSGKPKKVILYDEAKATASAGNIIPTFKIVDFYSPEGEHLVADGNGYYKETDKNGVIMEEGKVENFRKNGQWKGYQWNPQNVYSETYTDGKLISGSITDGTHTINYTTEKKWPQYKGGMQGFYEFVGKTFMYPRIDRERGVSGRVVLGFIVEKDGSISNIVVINSVSATIDAEAIQ